MDGSSGQSGFLGPEDEWDWLLRAPGGVPEEAGLHCRLRVWQKVDDDWGLVVGLAGIHQRMGVDRSWAGVHAHRVPCLLSDPGPPGPLCGPGSPHWAEKGIK